MKSILIVLSLLATTLLTVPTTALAAKQGINTEYSPFVPKVISKLDAVKERKMLAATLDCSVLANCTVGAHALGVILPAKSLLTQSYYYSAVQPVSSGGGTIAFSCEDANNILTAANLTSKTVGSISSGNQSGASVSMTASIASNCNVTATVASSDYTAGKLNLFVEYVTHD